MQQQIDNRGTLDTAMRLTPVQRALLQALRRLLIATLQTVEQLLATS